ncbi:uncharacterized protein DS421_2g47130 [Arachis hypogaea]|nr:uncharacterized protein DS421_2g47130 [Arachis hypogaea]
MTLSLFSFSLLSTFHRRILATACRHPSPPIAAACCRSSPADTTGGHRRPTLITTVPSFFWFVKLGSPFTMSTSRPARNSDAHAPGPAPASASAGHAAGTAARSAATVRATRIDPGWKYVSVVEDGNTNDTICNFCGKIMRGGITRANEHFMIKPGNVVGCQMVPKDVIAELWEFYNQKKIEEDKVLRRQA